MRTASDTTRFTHQAASQVPAGAGDLLGPCALGPNGHMASTTAGLPGDQALLLRSRACLSDRCLPGAWHGDACAEIGGIWLVRPVPGTCFPDLEP
jgi:hypothetical protein